MSHLTYRTYDTVRFPFAAVMADLYGVDDLARLHETEVFDRLRVGADQQTPLHRHFYDALDAGGHFAERFAALYRELVAEVVQPAVGEAIAFQSMPTLRIHQPGNVSVGSFHRDSAFGHPPTEIGFFLPLTACHGTNSMWTESEVGRGDHGPIEAEVGQLVSFDGANLEHGSHTNTTGATRVSFDFRAIPMSRYTPSDEVSATRRLPFRIGGYYELLAWDGSKATILDDLVAT